MNRGFEYRERVPRLDGESTLVDYLSARYDHSTRSQWEERVGRGQVTLDGAPAAPEQVLRGGESLTWHRPPWTEPDAPLSYAVLYRDEDVLGVAKPRGLPTLPGAGFLQNTLLWIVRRQYSDASPAHRIGRGTTGVVVFAANKESRSPLQVAWAGRTVLKRYVAVIQGRPALNAFDVDQPIGRVPHPRLGSVHAATPGGRPSRTRIRVVERREGETLVEAELDTGRPHQIRIHLAAAGHPIVGDALYAVGGGIISGDPALPGEPGYWLHASCVEFPHPRSGGRVRIDCVPPPRLRSGAAR